MPAIASLEDLKAAQKDLCYCMRVFCLKRSGPQVKRSSSHAKSVTILERSDHLEMASHRLEECVWSPHGKGSSHSNVEWGRHPGPKRMIFSAGANYGLRRELRRIEGQGRVRNKE